MKKQIVKNKRKTKKPNIIVLSGYGLNCEEETKFAFELAGGVAQIVHINDLVVKPTLLDTCDILAFPGGFSFGDDTGSGKAFANKIRNHLSLELHEFLSRDTLCIGICNGFQILTNLGILSGALTHNSGGRYIDRWVDLKVTGKSPWLKGIKNISLPIAHGEGKYIVDTKTYKNLKKSNQVAFVYEKGPICKFQNLDLNPNGAMYNIAGVLSKNGRVLGMMPHPERNIFFHQSPLWQKEKEILKRKGKSTAKLSNLNGDSLKIFKNAIEYFTK
ncbi:MAG: phosphoribosylformylglycinamidine synthase I [Candidatus Pacebacteria bacterium]|nr:phosphoribosylformylglycinamidine synthase I [Candidatus Paceibacterota bacterium]MCF7863059.1 phosphoribosylformylglycinamidine synthase I [Candidatus Paceibacterota bacterium]